ncbi:tyrosine-type recombinase/integrase [Hoeflea poritis]|uniref:Tyrosine-type recombinase/integrase n=1 Tax=Hoeflea poritis TaxID=2993659 RepID=A0ABT4VMH5_9HYPH|nr:tyrosine-type recombinase/integrase [Hoeflea poritis]MDA4845915.1 tyrosine-type recombinase/integrase [Hoeflea poritis]
MPFVRVKGFHCYKDRHKKPRCYHRKSRIPVDLDKFPMGSAQFFARCEEIRRLYEGQDDAKPGTLGRLIEDYKKDVVFTDLAPRTQADYQKIFDYLKPIQNTSLRWFTRGRVTKIRDKAVAKMGRKWGNYTQTVLSVVFGWGADRDYMQSNPAFRIKKVRQPKNAPQANRPWPDEAREIVWKRCPANMKPILGLMMFCALDPKDAVLLPRTAIKDGMIDTKRAKTSEPVWIPLPAPVQEAIDEAEEHTAVTVGANQQGKPYTVDGFRKNWQKLRNKMVEEGLIPSDLTLKGLRHTVATILAEMGYDDRTIADMLAQRTTAMAQHYSKRANRSRKLTGVVKDFETEVNRRRTKLQKRAE